MNTLNFNITGGYPFETDTLDELQKAYSIFNALGEISGNKTIVRGCTINGSTVSDGFVYIDGEFFEFKGGLQQSKVIIKEESVSKPFEDGKTNEVFHKRFVTFGTGTSAMNWNNFQRITSIKSLQSRILPPGTNPQLYTGAIANIPEGWQLCDGTNGTPDLRGKFIVGYNPNDNDYNNVGKTGGKKEQTITVNNLPEHEHSGTVSIPPHSHSYRDRFFAESSSSLSRPSDGGVENAGQRVAGSNQPDSDNNFYYYKNASTGSAGGGQRSFTTGKTGGNTPLDTRPPYYTLAYIIFIG